MAVRSPKKITYEEYSRLPDDDGRRYELIHGELFVTPAPNTRHQQIVVALVVEIGSHLRLQGGGSLFVAPYEVDFFDIDAVQPDLVFVAESHSEIITQAKILGVPSLVVEVVSSSQRDRRLKKDLYERHGVPEYWIFDPVSETVEVRRLSGRGYGPAQVLGKADRLATPLIQGLNIDLKEIF